MRKLTKQIILGSTLALSSFIFSSFGTIKSGDRRDEHVNWEFTTKKVDASTYQIIATARIDYPWHIFSQKTNEDLGKPTTFTFKKNPSIEIVGTPDEQGTLKEDNAKVRYYQGKVSFVQTVKVKAGANASALNLEGEVAYAVCNDGMCVPTPDISFDLTLN